MGTDPADAGSLVLSWVDRGVGVLRLADPGRRNALTPELNDQLALAVAHVLDAGVGAIVLTADPPVFCAGGSLEGLLRRDTPLDELYRGFLALADSPVPTVAAVGGPVIGAGVNLPLACDVIVASPSARFDPRFLDVGLHPGGGHLRMLRQRIGRQGAAALVLFGDVLDGHDAARRGLAWCCVEDSELESVAMGMAATAAGRPRELVRRTKATLQASDSSLTAADAVALEAAAQEWSMDQPGFKERVQSIRDSVGRRSGHPGPSAR
jgi:enoyl-CoA hydratase